MNARGGLCYWYASIIRAVIIGKSQLLEQAYLRVQGGRGASAGYTPNEFLKPTRQKRQVKAKYYESCETKKHFGQAHIK